MDNFTIISIAVGTLFVFLILIARIRAAGGSPVVEELYQPPAGQNVEYQWVAEPQVASKLLLFLGFAGGMVYAYFSIDLAREIFSSLFQVGMILLGFLGAFLNGLWQKKVYQLTNMGLYKIEKDTKNKKQKPEKVFFWNEVSWIKPGLKGFRYYLNNSSKINFEKDQVQLFRSSGFIPAGDNAMVVNSMLLSRGLKTSPGPNANEMEQASKTGK